VTAGLAIKVEVVEFALGCVTPEFALEVIAVRVVSELRPDEFLSCKVLAVVLVVGR